MEPLIDRFNRLNLVGLRTLIRGSLNAPNNLGAIPLLWQQMRNQVFQLEDRQGSERYALITGDLPEDKQTEAYYHALIAVTDFKRVPGHLVRWELSGGKLARFRYQGGPEAMGRVAYQVLHEWLPNSGETIAENLELVIFPASYERNNPQAESEYVLWLK